MRMVKPMLFQRNAYDLNVVGPPQGITQTREYQARVRIPNGPIRLAAGRATPMNIRVGLGAAGQLGMVRDSNGVLHYVVTYTARPG